MNSYKRNYFTTLEDNQDANNYSTNCFTAFKLTENLSLHQLLRSSENGSLKIFLTNYSSIIESRIQHSGTSIITPEVMKSSGYVGALLMHLK